MDDKSLANWIFFSIQSWIKLISNILSVKNGYIFLNLPCCYGNAGYFMLRKYSGLVSRVASLAFLKPNNSNLASFYNDWLGKISLGLKLFSGFFWLFSSKMKRTWCYQRIFVSHLSKSSCGLRYKPRISESYPNLVGWAWEN